MKKIMVILGMLILIGTVLLAHGNIENGNMNFNKQSTESYKGMGKGAGNMNVSKILQNDEEIMSRGNPECDSSCEQGDALQDGNGNMFGKNSSKISGRFSNSSSRGQMIGKGNSECDGSCEQGDALQDGNGNMFGKNSTVTSGRFSNSSSRGQMIGKGNSECDGSCEQCETTQDKLGNMSGKGRMQGNDSIQRKMNTASPRGRRR